MLVIKGVNLEYKDKVLLQDSNFEAKPGEITAIIGASGSGKTSFLNMLSLFTKLKCESYTINGVDIKKLTNRDKYHYRKNNISYIFQDYNLLEGLTVKENLVFGKQIQGKSLRIDLKKIKKFGLMKSLKKYPSELSGGQQQRVAILRELEKGNTVICADEPTSSLDKKNKELVYSYFEELKVCGCIVIIVTHDSFIKERADQVYTLTQGDLVTNNICDKTFNHVRKEVKMNSGTRMKQVIRSYQKTTTNHRANNIKIGLIAFSLFFVVLVNVFGLFYIDNQRNYLNDNIDRSFTDTLDSTGTPSGSIFNKFNAFDLSKVQNYSEENIEKSENVYAYEIDRNGLKIEGEAFKQASASEKMPVVISKSSLKEGEVAVTNSFADRGDILVGMKIEVVVSVPTISSGVTSIEQRVIQGRVIEVLPDNNVNNIEDVSGLLFNNEVLKNLQENSDQTLINSRVLTCKDYLTCSQTVQSYESATGTKVIRNETGEYIVLAAINLVKQIIKWSPLILLATLGTIAFIGQSLSLKRRQSEFGTLLVLGFSKAHVIWLIAAEKAKQFSRIVGVYLLFTLLLYIVLPKYMDFQYIYYPIVIFGGVQCFTFMGVAANIIWTPVIKYLKRGERYT